MRLLLLVTDAQNQTASNLIDALNLTGHRIDVVPYYRGGMNQCSVVETAEGWALVYENQLYLPSDYDGAMLWCWGTAALGRKYLRIFEEKGVEVLNSTDCTELTDSKIAIAHIFQQASIPTPLTLCFKGGDVDMKQIQQVLGAAPYVVKADYGTQGFGVEFAQSTQEVQDLALRLSIENPLSRGFIVQKFIGNPQYPITHYRVLVIGDRVLPVAMKVTAKQTLCVSNVAAGGRVEFIPMSSSMEKIALQATSASGLRMAGVDLMVSEDTGEILVLEVNDGPGTKTFDAAGYSASYQTVQYFLQIIQNRMLGNPKQKAI